MKLLIGVLFLLSNLSFAQAYKASNTAEPGATKPMISSFDHNYTSLNALLSKSVIMKSKGQKSIVNYKAISQAEVNSIVNQLLALDKVTVMKTFSKKQRLSYFINLYNILTIKLIKDNYAKVKKKGNSITKIGGLIYKKTWDMEFFKLFGKKMTLNMIEHGFIRGHESGFSQSRKEYNDPRIHFAVNCASKGCPALLNKSFTATNLESTLQKAMLGFLQDRSRNYVKNGKTVYLSSIFDWYEKDFSRGLKSYSSLKDFVAKNAEHIAENPADLAKLKSKQLDIKFSKYDWTLNDAI